jgi:hypothetical protein
MTHEQNALAAVFARYHLCRTAQTQNHIAPALTTRRPMIEFAEQAPEFRLIGVVGFDADSREAIENSKFLFAESLVYNESVLVACKTSGACNDLGSVSRANVWRSQDDVRSLVGRQRSEPSSEGLGLLDSEIGQLDVNVANVDVDHVVTRELCSFASDITC